MLDFATPRLEVHTEKKNIVLPLLIDRSRINIEALEKFDPSLNVNPLGYQENFAASHIFRVSAKFIARIVLQLFKNEEKIVVNEFQNLSFMLKLQFFYAEFFDIPVI